MRVSDIATQLSIILSVFFELFSQNINNYQLVCHCSSFLIVLTFIRELRIMTKVAAINILRIFIGGVSDNISAAAVEDRARSLTGVIACRVTAGGVCVVQSNGAVVPTIDEPVLINWLTFDK